jgi:DNA-binding NarL/FixJ family response regulator
MRIVIADDHTITRLGMQQLFQGEDDLQVIAEAGTGSDALRIVEALRPDILLLDINMPGMSGVEVARTLRGTMPELRIVILTGYDDEHYVQTLLQLGVRGYLSKSAPAREVVLAMRAVYAGGTYVQAGLLDPLGSSNGRDAPTERELDVLRLVAKGYRNHSIAESLAMSERTVHAHLRSLFAKLEVSSRSELTYQARHRGWIT